VASTLVLGQSWNVVNNSTGAVTINSSGGNNIIILAPSTQAIVTCILASGTTAASWSTTSAISGVTTNSSASAGQVGEYVSSTVLVASQVSLTTNTAANVTSISLTAGDWGVGGCVVFYQAGPTTSSFQLAWTSSTSSTPPTLPNSGGLTQLTTTFSVGGVQVLAVPRQRFSLSGTTTIYLGGYATFGVSTCAAYGHINARRVR